MVLKTTGSVSVVLLSTFLCGSGVLGETDWGVSYLNQRVCVFEEDSSVELPCLYRYPAGYAVTKVAWFRMGDWVSGSEPDNLSQNPQYVGRVEYLGDLERSCTLRITHLRKSDSGVYRFRFWTNKLEVKYFGWPGVSLYVTGNVRVVVTEIPGQADILALTCESSCTMTDPNISFSWFRNGHPVPWLFRRQHNLTAEAANSYSCAVKGHEADRSPAVCVIGRSCLRVSYTSRRVCGLPGSTLDLSCIYRSGEAVTSAFWFRSGDLKRREGAFKSTLVDVLRDPGYAGRVMIVSRTERRSTLRISDLRDEDAAEYRFMVKTQSTEWGRSFPGTTLSVAQLRVTAFPAAVTEGQNVTLICGSTCALTSDLIYVWRRDGQKLTSPSTLDNILYLHPISSVDTGSYSCAVGVHEDLTSPAFFFTFDLQKTEGSRLTFMAILVFSAGLVVVVVMATVAPLVYVLRRRLARGSEVTPLPAPGGDLYISLDMRTRSSDYDIPQGKGVCTPGDTDDPVYENIQN